MSIVIDLDQECPDERRATNVLTFPADDFAPLPRLSWLEWAKIEIAAFRARRARSTGKDVGRHLETPERCTGPQLSPEPLSSTWTEPETVTVKVAMDGWHSDVSGSPSETLNWSQYQAVLEARQREL